MILWRECYANDFDDDYLLCNFVKIKFFFDRNTRNSLNFLNKKEKRDISLLFSYIVIYHLYILNLKKKRKISIKICIHNNNFIQKCSPTINNIFDKSISINIVNIIDCILKRINRIQNIIISTSLSISFLITLLSILLIVLASLTRDSTFQEMNTIEVFMYNSYMHTFLSYLIIQLSSIIWINRETRSFGPQMFLDPIIRTNRRIRLFGSQFFLKRVYRSVTMDDKS